jgi:transcription termination factor Rho
VSKAELESKHLAELHALAAEAGVERYRMLPRAELIEKLAGGDGGGGRSGGAEPKGGRPRQRSRRGGGDKARERGSREGAERKPRDDRKAGGEGRPSKERQPRRERTPRVEQDEKREPAAESKPEPSIAPATTPPPKRRRRRRRWGRRRKGVRLHDLLLPPAPGRRAIVYAEGRAGCTALLRELAAELAGASKGPDPIALLIDPSPEELADWKREAPAAEIVAAGKAAHADDALAQAARRAAGGEDVIVLIDSLTRFAEGFGGAEEARDLFDAGQDATGGTLTVVAALERSV